MAGWGESLELEPSDVHGSQTLFSPVPYTPASPPAPLGVSSGGSMGCHLPIPPLPMQKVGAAWKLGLDLHVFWCLSARPTLHLSGYNLFWVGLWYAVPGPRAVSLPFIILLVSYLPWRRGFHWRWGSWDTCTDLLPTHSLAYNQFQLHSSFVSCLTCSNIIK